MRWNLLGGMVVLLLVACVQHWRIQDRQGNDVVVEGLEFSPRRQVSLRIGALTRELEFYQINELRVEPRQRFSEDGVVYYSAYVELKDGTLYPFSHSKDSTVFIDVSGNVIGSSQGGRFEIPLAQVHRIRRGLTKDTLELTDSAVVDSSKIPDTLMNDSTTTQTENQDSVVPSPQSQSQ